jgi:hypothetical protein
MFKKGLKHQTWCSKGFKIEIIEENAEILRKLEADVFSKKKKAEK